MNSIPLLSFPRLHRELLPSHPECATLWPGLSHAPAGTWVPHLPLSPALADASLSDFRRACRDGACGSPVHALSLEKAPSDITGEELRALRELKGLPPDPPEQPLRAVAQQILILAWLQEEQTLEMALLEQKIRTSRTALKGLITGTASSGLESPQPPSERELPSWEKMLAAFLAFTPDLPAGTALLATSREMSAALKEWLTIHPLPCSDGSTSIRVRISELIGLCPAIYADRLRRDPGIDASKEISVIIPSDQTI